jgi:hypothetical protein
MHERKTRSQETEKIKKPNPQRNPAWSAVHHSKSMKIEEPQRRKQSRLPVEANDEIENESIMTRDPGRNCRMSKRTATAKEQYLVPTAVV